MLLLCAGAAASLAGVWALAGLSESSALRTTPRVVAATAVGVLGAAGAYGFAPAGLQGELLLPLLFGTAGVLSLAVGAAKMEAALVEKDGQRVVRRASGIVAGSFFAMAAVGAASFDLSASSLTAARLGWTLMFAPVVSALVVFAQRTRYAGLGLLALGQRAWVLAAVAAALLAGAWLMRPPPPQPATLTATSVALASPPPPAPPVQSAGGELPGAPSASASAGLAPSGTGPVELRIEGLSVRGMLEEDARGGIARRMKSLEACLAEPQNQQPGTLSVKAGIDATGSVAFSRPSGGDLSGAPIAACVVPVFYKMGFAAPASNNASLELKLRVAAP